MEESKGFISFSYKFFIAVILFIFVFVLSMILGAAEVSIKDVWIAISTNINSDKILIIREIRLPREIGAIFVGAALAVSGAIMQGISRNPLADPGLLGLTAGANAALAITIVFMPSASYMVILISCFIGAAAAVFLVFGITAAKKNSFSPLRIVLTGSAVSAFLYAVAQGIQIYFKVSKDVSMWTSGGLIGTSWDQLAIIIPFIIVGITTAIALSRQLTILSLSEEVSVGLGQKTAIVKALLFVVVTLLTGASVALASNLVFLGLIIPHIAYFVVGRDYRFVISISAVFGATLMLFADTIGRIISAPYETPVVAIISVIGLPFFLFIVRKGGKS